MPGLLLGLLRLLGLLWPLLWLRIGLWELLWTLPSVPPGLLWVIWLNPMMRTRGVRDERCTVQSE